MTNLINMGQEELLNQVNLKYPNENFKILKSGLVYSNKLKIGVFSSYKNRPHKSYLPKKCIKVILFTDI
jgi:hypothetical protein